MPHNTATTWNRFDDSSVRICRASPISLPVRSVERVTISGNGERMGTSGEDMPLASTPEHLKLRSTRDLEVTRRALRWNTLREFCGGSNSKLRSFVYLLSPLRVVGD